MHRRFFVLFCLICAWVPAAWGQSTGSGSYPSRPIRLIVGYSAGGMPDTLARILSESMSKTLGQPIVVENRPGAGGMISAAVAANSAPDGYTLTLAGTGQTSIAPYMFKSLGYDPIKSFTQIGMLAKSPMYIVCNPAKRADLCTVEGIIRAARAQPGVLTYGSSGVGSGHHISMEMFSAGQQIKLVHVPYKGSGQSTAPMLSGEVDIAMLSLPPLIAHLNSGRLKLVAVNTTMPSPLHPDVPVMANWVPGLDFPSENGLLAPAGLPGEVLDKLLKSLDAARSSPDVVAKMRALDAEVVSADGVRYKQLLEANLKKYEAATKVAGIQAQ